MNGSFACRLLHRLRALRRQHRRAVACAAAVEVHPHERGGPARASRPSCCRRARATATSSPSAARSARQPRLEDVSDRAAVREHLLHQHGRRQRADRCERASPSSPGGTAARGASRRGGRGCSIRCCSTTTSRRARRSARCSSEASRTSRCRRRRGRRRRSTSPSMPLVCVSSMPDGDLVPRLRVGELQLGQVLPHRRVEVDETVVHELHHERRRVHLRVRADLEERRRRDRHARCSGSRRPVDELDELVTVQDRRATRRGPCADARASSSAAWTSEIFDASVVMLLPLSLVQSSSSTKRRDERARSGILSTTTCSPSACAPPPTGPSPSSVGVPSGRGEVPVRCAADLDAVERLEAELRRDLLARARTDASDAVARRAADGRSCTRRRSSTSSMCGASADHRVVARAACSAIVVRADVDEQASRARARCSTPSRACAIVGVTVGRPSASASISKHLMRELDQARCVPLAGRARRATRDRAP